MKSLIPWRRRTGGAFETLRHEMEGLFERFFGEPLEGNGGEGLRAWAPRVDIEETDKELLVKADLPGVDPKDVDISVSDGSLVLRGEKKEEREERKKTYHRVERFVGQFYREIPLPSGTDPDKITATGSKGVITVTIPKTPQAQTKKITVKAQD
jgi:HSP20 family protein